MSLAKQLLNNPGLQALCVMDELNDVKAVLDAPRPISVRPMGIVKLMRIFNMTFDGVTMKFWRVNCPGHPNHNSDLSLEGLKQWGIIQ